MNTQTIAIASKSLTIPKRLAHLSVQFYRGEITHILGTNGSGKSTFLNALAGLIPYEGEVILENQPLRHIDGMDLAKKRALLSQQQMPNFNIGVYQYLYLNLPANVLTQVQKINRIVLYISQQLNIEDKLNDSLNHLSGGEWQRVRLAGVFLQIWPDLNPEGALLLLDEPATGLDIAQQANLYRLLHQLAAQGVCILMTNHDINRALSDADRVMLLKQGDLIALGSPEKILTESMLQQTFETPFRIAELDGMKIVLHRPHSDD